MPRDPADPVEKSKFHLDVKNSIGLEYKKVRMDLMSLALSKPSLYYDLRKEIITAITEKQVEDAYELYWDLLRNGIIGGDQMEYVNTVGGKVNFVPNLPEQKISQFAMKVAQTIEDICEEAVSLILPDDYLQLAQQRQKDVLASKGMMEE